MNACELTASVTALANALSRAMTASELALLAAILVQLGDTLTTILTNELYAEEILKKKSR